MLAEDREANGTVCHDTPVMVHKDADRHFLPIMQSQDWGPFQESMKQDLSRWNAEAKLVVYFDGARIPAKIANRVRRERQGAVASMRDHHGPYEYSARRAQQLAELDGKVVCVPLEAHGYSPSYLEWARGSIKGKAAKKLRVAVHGKMIDAIPHVRQVCQDLGIPTQMSAKEVDAQMPFDMSKEPWVIGIQGGKAAVATVDSDLIFQQHGAASHILFSKGASMKDGLAGHLKLSRLWSTAEFSQAGNNPTFDLIVEEFGPRGIEFWACGAPNDYTKGLLPGCDVATGLEAVLQVHHHLPLFLIPAPCRCTFKA